MSKTWKPPSINLNRYQQSCLSHYKYQYKCNLLESNCVAISDGRSQFYRQYTFPYTLLSLYTSIQDQSNRKSQVAISDGFWTLLQVVSIPLPTLSKKMKCVKYKKAPSLCLGPNNVTRQQFLMVFGHFYRRYPSPYTLLPL